LWIFIIIVYVNTKTNTFEQYVLRTYQSINQSVNQSIQFGTQYNTQFMIEANKNVEYLQI
jgi:biopolymer transport protein ExbD